MFNFGHDSFFLIHKTSLSCGSTYYLYSISVTGLGTLMFRGGIHHSLYTILSHLGSYSIFIYKD